MNLELFQREEIENEKEEVKIIEMESGEVATLARKVLEIFANNIHNTLTSKEFPNSLEAKSLRLGIYSSCGLSAVLQFPRNCCFYSTISETLRIWGLDLITPKCLSCAISRFVQNYSEDILNKDCYYLRCSLSCQDI